MRDPKIEQALNAKADVAWEYKEAIPIRGIDRKKSESNQARIENSIDKALVDQYVQAYRNGDRFPAVVVYIDGDDFVNIDGNHRYEMYERLAVTHTDAYVVLTDDPRELLALTFEMNTLNGRPADEEDKEQQAITLAARGFSQTEIATRLHISKTKVRFALIINDGEARAKRLGVKRQYGQIKTLEAKVAIQSQIALDSVFGVVVEFQARHALIGAEFRPFMVELLQNTSEADQLAYVDHRNKTKVVKYSNGGEKGTSGRTMDRKTQLTAHLSYLVNVNATPILVGLTESEKALMRRQAQSAKATIDGILAEIDA